MATHAHGPLAADRQPCVDGRGPISRKQASLAKRTQQCHKRLASAHKAAQRPKPSDGFKRVNARPTKDAYASVAAHEPAQARALAFAGERASGLAT